jgi:predicted DNA-binding transcriptional regulator AlpA
MAETPNSIHDAKQQPTCEMYVFGGRTPMAILRLPAVKARTGLSRATIYRKIQSADFPRPHQLSRRAVGWLESDIEAWIASCIAGGANDH